MPGEKKPFQGFCAWDGRLAVGRSRGDKHRLGLPLSFLQRSGEGGRRWAVWPGGKRHPPRAAVLDAWRKRLSAGTVLAGCPRLGGGPRAGARRSQTERLSVVQNNQASPAGLAVVSNIQLLCAGGAWERHPIHAP